jgi:hypothetical protein
MKIRQLGAELLHTDRHDEAFRNFDSARKEAVNMLGLLTL